MAMSVVYTNFGGQLVHEVRGGVETAYVSDTLGSVMMCTNASGVTTYAADYWPYGEIASSTGANPSSFGFAGTLGYYTDAAPGALYVRARTYLPSYGRWAQADPLWPRAGAYGYGAESPASKVDPNGLLAICVLPCACAAACAVDLLAVCADWSGFSSYEDCLWKTYGELPGWLKAIRWACIGVCIACLVRRAIKPPAGPPPAEPVPEPAPAPPTAPDPGPQLPRCPPRAKINLPCT